MIAGHHELQELSKTHYQISLARTRLQHSVLTHYVPLYFPEIERYFHSTHADWFARFLIAYPTAASIQAVPFDVFERITSDCVGRKVNKRAWIRELYDTALTSIGLPVATDSVVIETYRLQLSRYQQLSVQREALCERAHALLHGLGPLTRHYDPFPG